MSRFWSNAIVVVFALLLVGITHAVFVSESNTPLDIHDVYYGWLEGHRINEGENPYARILESDMRKNDKYATYLPGFYLLAAGIERSGVEGFDDFVPIWRRIQEVFYLSLGLMIMALLYHRGGALLAIAGSFFWFLNRWTLAVIPIAHIEPMAVFFLIAAWVLYDRSPYRALVLFSLSLVVKQIAIFLVPLFLIREWMAHSEAGWKIAARKSALALGVMSVVPLALSIPFMVWNFEAFIKSILFSATREASDHMLGMAPSIDTMSGLVGLAGKLPMLFLLALVYVMFWKRKINWNLAGLLVMTIFIEFNAVLFVQYFFWLTPFLLLVVADVWQNKEREAAP